jgi:tetratricopeptide (TPR) repeat protein
MAATRPNYRDSPARGPDASPAAALELSYRRLAETDARVFRLLPLNPGPDVSSAAAAVLVDLPVGQARHSLAALAWAYLVEAVPGGGGRWRLRDLVGLYAQQLSDTHAEADGREQARDRLFGYYLHMTDAADEWLRMLPEQAVPTEFTSPADALAWLDAEQASLTAAVEMAADTGRDQVAARLPLLLAQYLAWRRRFDDLVAVTTIGLDAARRLHDRDGEGDALNNLGGALLEICRLEDAVTAHQEAVTIYRETGNADGEADALNNLGLVLKDMRRFDDAITTHQNAARIYREIGDRHGDGNALNNLGLALEAVGRVGDAISMYQDAAAILRETGDQHGEGVALSNLAGVLGPSGKPEEAISALQDAAAIFRETGDRDRERRTLEALEDSAGTADLTR